MDTTDQAVLPPLTPISASVSLRDQAYAALKQMITDADIYARSRTRSVSTSGSCRPALGVSRTPIREAMTLLEQEGFLRTEPRRGIFIVRKTKKQIIEMIEMWAALESMAARLATVNASDADIAALRRMFDEFRTATPAEHIEEYSDANIAFHQAIIRLSGSHLMGKTIDNLFIHVRAIRKMTISQNGPRRALDRSTTCGSSRRSSAATPSSPSGSCASTRSTSPRTSRSTATSSTDGIGELPPTIDTSGLRRKRGPRNRPKGRALDPRAAADVAALLGDAPRRRDLLIEHLHRIQDRYGCLSAAHLVGARGRDEARDDRGVRGRDVLPPLRRREGRARRRRLRSRCACARRSRAQMAGGDALRREIAPMRDARRARAAARPASAAASTRRRRSSGAIPSTPPPRRRSPQADRRQAHGAAMRAAPSIYAAYRASGRLPDCCSECVRRRARAPMR